MKNIYLILLTIVFASSAFAEENQTESMKESDYENGCENEIDDDMDGNVDSDDDDCKSGAVLFSADDFEADSLRPYLVWGVGIALLSSVSSDSGTGTATTD